MGRAEHFRISHTRAVEGTYRHITELSEAGLVLADGFERQWALRRSRRQAVSELRVL